MKKQNFLKILFLLITTHMSTSFAQQPKCYNLSESEYSDLLAQIMEYASKEGNFSGSRRVLAKKPLILKYKKQIILASIGVAAATTGGLLLANYNDSVRDWCQETPLLKLFIWNKKISKNETNKNKDSKDLNNSNGADSNKQKNSNPENTKLDENRETLVETAQKEIDHLNAKKDLSKEEQKALLQNQLKIKNNEVLELAKQHKQKTIETEEFDKQKKLLLSEVSNLKEQITLLSTDT